MALFSPFGVSLQISWAVLCNALSNISLEKLIDHYNNLFLYFQFRQSPLRLQYLLRRGKGYLAFHTPSMSATLFLSGISASQFYIHPKFRHLGQGNFPYFTTCCFYHLELTSKSPLSKPPLIHISAARSFTRSLGIICLLA